jgi:hypothetical protein
LITFQLLKSFPRTEIFDVSLGLEQKCEHLTLSVVKAALHLYFSQASLFDAATGFIKSMTTILPPWSEINLRIPQNQNDTGTGEVLETRQFCSGGSR